MGNCMLTGKLIAFDIESKKGKIEQDLNRRVFDFDFSVWDEKSPMELNTEVEFEVEMRIVTKARQKPKPIDPDEIPVTKDSQDCIMEFFHRENEILIAYADFVQTHLKIDFLRMRRFLLTAYNDLCAMDNLVENDKLRALKNEILSLFKDFEEYVKKAKYAPAYAFEKIFLDKQSQYLKVVRDIEETQSLLANAKAQVQVLGNALETQERQLRQLAGNKRSQEYIHLEKEVKNSRKIYTDLIHFIATRQDFILKQNERIKKFKDAHLQSFINVYAPMLKQIKERFIEILDSKAYDLDSALWDRAKQSQIVRKFFRDACIEGGFCSKTFLRYFLRGLDRNKVSAQSKELFSLLKYLEDISRKNILVLRASSVDASRCKEIIKKIDPTLNISIEQNPLNALKLLVAKPQDIVVMDEKVGTIEVQDFIAQSKQLPNQKPIIFCAIVKNMPDYEATQKGKEAGISYFIPDQNMDAMFDSVRMAL